MHSILKDLGFNITMTYTPFGPSYVDVAYDRDVRIRMGIKTKHPFRQDQQKYLLIPKKKRLLLKAILSIYEEELYESWWLLKRGKPPIYIDLTRK